MNEDNHNGDAKEDTPITFDETRKGPVSGVCVIDASRLVAGNMLSLQLADFGADVIKIEAPVGDALRHWKDNGKSFHWKVYARNKRSIVLNLRMEEARDALKRMLVKADVFIENYRPGTLENMGLGPDVLLELNPNLIIVRISGFGQTGPYAKKPGFGTLVEAMSGFAARTGFPDREPVLPPLALADMIAGLQGATATMMALRAREIGQASGQVIDLSLLEPIIGILGPEAAIYKEIHEVKERAGSGSKTSSPRNVYKCADGKFVALSGSMQTMAMRIFDVIGRPDMKDDPRFALNTARVKNRELVDEAVGGWFASMPRDEALAIMNENAITVAPIYDISQAVEDPHFVGRQVFIDAVDDELGVVPMHNITPRLSGTPGVWRRPAPKMGEHTNEVLHWVGYDDAEIEELRHKEAIA